MKDRLRLVHETSNAAENLRKQSLFTSNSIETSTRIYLINYLEIMTEFKSRYLRNKEELAGKLETLNSHFLIEMKRMTTMNENNRREILNLMPYFYALSSYSNHIISTYNERTPILIIILLIVSSLLISVLVGFLNGFYTVPHYLVPLIFIVLVSLCIQIIRDLDNPFSGNIQPIFSDLKYQLQNLKKSSH